MKKEIGAALVVALQMITLTLIGLMAPLAGGPQQSANAATYAVTADFVPDDTTNYNTLTVLSAGNFVIQKANATVVVMTYNVTYDGQSHTASYTITGVNGETGATVGTVTLNTTHTNAGTYSTDSWSFTGTANYNDIASTTITDTINKANATVVVTPYSVTYDGMSHTAAVTSITGVNGEIGATVGTVDVSNTTHTNAGTYASDYWFFTGTANYNNIGNTTITDTIGYGTCTGSDPGGVILPPINSDGTSVYKRKAGSTIPVKFTVCGANGNPISDPYAVFSGYPNGAQLTMLSHLRGTVDNVNEVGTNDIPNAAFTFTGGQWHFNMATTNLEVGTYTYHINLAYGPGITFVVGLK